MHRRERLLPAESARDARPPRAAASGSGAEREDRPGGRGTLAASSAGSRAVERLRGVRISSPAARPRRVRAPRPRGGATSRALADPPSQRASPPRNVPGRTPIGRASIRAGTGTVRPCRSGRSASSTRSRSTGRARRRRGRGTGSTTAWTADHLLLAALARCTITPALPRPARRRSTWSRARRRAVGQSARRRPLRVRRGRVRARRRARPPSRRTEGSSG